MTENKLELLKLIFENNDVEQAVLIFADIISYFSKQHEADQEQVFVDQKSMYQTN